MKTKTKVGVALVAVLAVAFGVVRHYWNDSVDIMSPSECKRAVIDFYNIGRETPLSPEIDLPVGVGIENERVMWFLMELDGQLGTVKLERNFLGRYKIVNISYGGGDFTDGAVVGGDAPYYLFGGRDMTGRIAKITLTHEGETYTMTQPAGNDYFIFCEELDPQTKDLDVNRGELRFYDEQGSDITADYDLSGGGIGWG